MANRAFYGALDAGEYAATLTREWKTRDGEIWRRDDLLGMMDTADSEGPLDEEDEDVYYVVDENGAVGMTTNGERTVDWFATPTMLRTSARPQNAFCPGCGGRVAYDWLFCQRCGYRLK